MNEFLKFCETNTGTNLLTQEEYKIDSQRTIGNQPGIARSKFVNKVLRQNSFIANALAQYVSNKTGEDVLDNNDTDAFLALMALAFPEPPPPPLGVPTGTILPFASNVLPTPNGYFGCTGGAISRTTYPNLFYKLVTEPANYFGFALTTFTITIASPAVVTRTSHNLKNGDRLRLSTSGALPTGLNTTTDYFVEVINANTFYLKTFANIVNNTRVNTSGTQSGTHQYLQSLWGLGDGSTTFNVPDLRGVTIRFLDELRGLDVARSAGTFQMDAFQGHQHFYYDNQNGAGSSGAAGTSSFRQLTTHGALQNDGTNGVPRTANQTIMRNIGLWPIIKY